MRDQGDSGHLLNRIFIDQKDTTVSLLEGRKVSTSCGVPSLTDGAFLEQQEFVGIKRRKVQVVRNHYDCNIFLPLSEPNINSMTWTW